MTTTLYSKIAAVSKAVGSLETDKTNQQQRYDYISADKILSVVGAKMAEHGLVIIPTVISQTVNEATSSTGKKFFDAEIGFVMIVGDGGEATVEALWIGRGSDYAVPDKAIYKAITSGHKYFLMKLFNIGVGNEDGEHETPNQQEQPRPITVENGGKKSPRVIIPPSDDESLMNGAGYPANGMARQYPIGASVTVKGKNDEKPGTVKGYAGDLVTVTIGDKDFNLSPDKVTVVEAEPVQDDLFGDAPDATYQE